MDNIQVTRCNSTFVFLNQTFSCRYGPEAAAAVANDPGAMQRLQEQAHHQHHHSGGAGGKLPPSASSSTGMLHSSANTTSSRLSTLPQVEKMATAFSEAMGTKSNYMDVRTAGGAMECREGGVGGGAGVGGDGGVEMRSGVENGTEAGEDSDDDNHGSASEISTIAKEVDKVNQIINNCIDALKLDVSGNVATTAENSNPASSQPPPCMPSLSRTLLPLSPGHPGDQIMASSPKVHPKSHTQPHLQPHPQPHPQLHQQPHPPSMAPVPLVMPLSERPGISGGGFLTPPYRDPPPANAVRPLQRQLSADTTVVKNRGATSAVAPVKSNRVFAVDIPEQRSDPPKYQEKGSPVVCSGGSGGGGGGGGCNGSGMGSVNGAGVSMNGGSLGCNSGNGSGVVNHAQQQQQQQHLEVQPDYHNSEHRHSFPALYYEGVKDLPSPTQKASFLKPIGRSRRDAAATYSQLSPSHHHSYNSGYSSSPEYSSESTLRIWERFRPYKKSPREEASYIAAGHALRKKVQFAKDEDLHDILDYWKGVSAQQKL